MTSFPRTEDEPAPEGGAEDCPSPYSESKTVEILTWIGPLIVLTKYALG